MIRLCSGSFCLIKAHYTSLIHTNYYYKCLKSSSCSLPPFFSPVFSCRSFFQRKNQSGFTLPAIPLCQLKIQKPILKPAGECPLYIFSTQQLLSKTLPQMAGAPVHL